MSNAKNTQTEKAAATETPVKKDGPMVYCGPTVKNTVKQYTVYHDSKAVPDAVNRFLDAVPMARGLLVHYEPDLVVVVTPAVMLIVMGTVLVFGVTITTLCALISINKYLYMKVSELYK